MNANNNKHNGNGKTITNNKIIRNESYGYTGNNGNNGNNLNNLNNWNIGILESGK